MYLLISTPKQQSEYIVPVLKGNGAGEYTGTWDMLRLRAAYRFAVSLSSLLFKAPSDVIPVMGRRVAYKQAHDLFIPSLEITK